MNEADIAAILYLWTRDAGMPVTEETEATIRQHLRAIVDNDVHVYSDEARAGMVAVLAKEICGI